MVNRAGWSSSPACSAFVLICLAAVSGYIRTDEATKGYYTNRLRMLAAAGVGAAGVVIYQMSPESRRIRSRDRPGSGSPLRPRGFC